MLWVISARWIFFKKGDVFLEKHPGFLRHRGFGNSSSVLTAQQIRDYALLGLFGGIIGMIMMWVMEMPVLKM